MLAVEALDHTLGGGKTHLICGGYDKGLDLGSLAALRPRLAGMYTIGTTGDAIAAGSGGMAVRCGTLDVAVREAVARARAGEAVLLSPGCASWDQFEHFEARGRAFEAFARAMTEGAVR